MTTPRVAILGAGIMGVSTALFLARRNVHVTIFDQQDEAMRAASRWNEGKIHLGFLYNANSTLSSARQVLPGGLGFQALVEELTGTSIRDHTTSSDDIYLCHRDSVVSPDGMEKYFYDVSRLIREYPDAARYCVDVSDCQVRRLTGQELARVTDSGEIVAGFKVPERSVATQWLADQFAAALKAEQRIETRFNTRVSGVSHSQSAKSSRQWQVNSSAGDCGPYDYVVNALWEGRLHIDHGLGLPLPERWSHRYRQSLFVRTSIPLAHPSVVIATGPFGDIKNYNGRDFYLSWYPTGLRSESHEILPEAPALAKSDTNRVTTDMFDSLQVLLPEVASIRDNLEQVELAGGWVYAAADGSLADPAATLHSRSGFGVSSSGTYFSVDTGKYSTGPWLARLLADQIKPG